MQDKQKPFILNEKIIHSWKGIMVRNRNRNVSHWLPPCPWNEFFIDLQRFTKEQCVSNSFNRTSNSRKQHPHVLFNCFMEQSNWQQNTGTSQQHPQLTDALKKMLLLWNGQRKCKINVENNNRTMISYSLCWYNYENWRLSSPWRPPLRVSILCHFICYHSYFPKNTAFLKSPVQMSNECSKQKHDISWVIPCLVI